MLQETMLRRPQVQEKISAFNLFLQHGYSLSEFGFGNNYDSDKCE